MFANRELVESARREIKELQGDLCAFEKASSSSSSSSSTSTTATVGDPVIAVEVGSSDAAHNADAAARAKAAVADRLLAAAFAYDYRHPALRSAQNHTSRFTEALRRQQRERAAAMLIQSVVRAKVIKGSGLVGGSGGGGGGGGGDGDGGTGVAHSNSRDKSAKSNGGLERAAAAQP